MGVANNARRISRKESSAAIGAEVRNIRAELAAALADAERLQTARMQAASFDDAETMGRQIAAARWKAEKLAARLPELESHLAHAKAMERAEAIAHHWARRRAVFAKLKAALEHAAEMQAEAIRADQHACAELGESEARAILPSIAYRGILLPDLVAMWTAECDRLLHAHATKPAAPAAAKTPAQQPIRSGQSPNLTDAPAALSLDPTNTTSPKRTPPIDDTSPLAPGEVRAVILRNGYPGPTGSAYRTGDRIRLPRELALTAARAGALELLQEETAAGQPVPPMLAPEGKPQ